MADSCFKCLPQLMATLALSFCSASFGSLEAFAQNGVQVSEAGDSDFSALVFSRTAGFRHQSIETGVEAIRTLGQQHSFRVEATEDPSFFSDETLSRFRVVVFLNTTGDILDASQQAVLERFIQTGGGFVGVHSATDTEYDWPWYGELVGAYFKSHPKTQPALLHVVNPEHPSTKGLPAQWERTDEWYNFRADPTPNVKVLMRLDEASYTGGEMGESHPAAWMHQRFGGRAFYTALGHTVESYSEPAFLHHLLGGLLWAAGVLD